MILLIILLAVGVVYASLYLLALYHPYNEFLLTATRPTRVFFMLWRYKNSLSSAWRMETIVDQHRIEAHEEEENAHHLFACFTREINEIMEGPAYPINEVDPTGAGDVFAAAFLTHLHKHGNPEQAIDFANCTASFSVEQAGIAGIPTTDMVLQRMTEKKNFTV